MRKEKKNINVEGEELEQYNEKTARNEEPEQSEKNAGAETEADETAEQEADTEAAIQKEAEEWKDKYIRLAAEFDNSKKRTLKEKSELILNFELIFKKFVKVLETLGVKRIETDDADFNVDYHEAVAMVPGMGDEKKGKVIDCVQTGYTLNDKVIRHAKVAVGQ